MALVIRKVEENEVVTKSGEKLSGRSLKLCTFKVNAKWRGRKIGERLLYTAFKHAIEKQIDWIYLTTFGEEQEMLVTLCEQFGFEKIGIDHQGRDDVYCKDMRKPISRGTLSNINYAIKHYPHYINDYSVKKWVIPIQPKYHDMLFPDISSWKDDLFQDDPNVYGPYSNTIRKAYLCHSKVGKITPGDVIYFYRSADRKSVECIGIVEFSFRSKDAQEILASVSKRTVYSHNEIEEMAKKDTLVIMFRLLAYIPKVTDVELKDKGIIGNIQSIRSLTEPL